MDITSTNTLSQMSTNAQTTSANEAIKLKNKAPLTYGDARQSEDIDKMSKMIEKYRDIYTPIPEDIISENIDINDVMNKFAQLYKGAPAKLGKGLTKEQLHQQQVAYDKLNAWVVEQVGALDANVLTRFFNANVYEGLESGKSVSEAITDALDSKDSFVDIQKLSQKSHTKYDNRLVSQKIEISLGLFDEYKIYDSIDIKG